MQELDALKPVVDAVIAALQKDAAVIAGNVAADAAQKAALDVANAELVTDAAQIKELTDKLNAALAANPPPA